MDKYNIMTGDASEIGQISKIISIPINRPLQSFTVNTFNLVFEVIWLSAYSTPIKDTFTFSLSGSNPISTRLYKLPNFASDSTSENVVLEIIDDFVNIYVKSVHQFSSVYVNIIGVSDANISVFHQFSPFIDASSITYTSATELSDTLNDSSVISSSVETSILRNSTLNSIYHNSTSIDLTLDDFTPTRSYFILVSDRGDRFANINVRSESINVTNIGLTNIDAVLNGDTITFSNLGEYSFLFYLIIRSY